MRKKALTLLACAGVMFAALSSMGCVAGTAVVSTPSSTYVTVGRHMYRCEGTAGARPVCQMVTEQ